MDRIIREMDTPLDATDRALLHLLSMQPLSSALHHTKGEGGEDVSSAPILSEAGWQELTERATQLGVAPLIYDLLQHHATPESVPAVVMQSLKSQSNGSTLYNLLLFQQLHELLRVFHKHGVAVMLLKGAFFAKVVYRSIGLRTMSDLDLMVHERDLDLVYRLLAELNFERGSVKSADNEIMNPREASYHNWFSHATKHLKIEVHWSTEDPDSNLAIDVESLWARATTTEYFGIPVYLLSPEDTLLHQCIHLSYHHIFQYFALRGLCDIKHLTTFYGSALDWEHFCQLAIQWKAQRSVALSLLLAQRLLHAEIPASVFESLGATQVDKRIYHLAWQRLLGKVDQNQAPWASNLARWHLSKSWLGKLEAGLRLCFPPRRQIAAQFQVPLTSPRLWLAYVERWGTLTSYLTTGKRTQFPLASSPEADFSHPHHTEIGRTALILWLHENT